MKKKKLSRRGSSSASPAARRVMKERSGQGMSFLINNAGTILTAAVLLLAVFLVAGKMIRDRKAGKGSCGCCGGSCAAGRNCTDGGHAARRNGQKKENV